MLVATIKRSAFQGMGKRVAKIKDFAQAGFALVAADHAGFDLHVASDQGTERFAVAPQDPVQVLFEASEQRRVRNDRVLDDFCKPATEFAVGKGAEKVRVGDHQSRWVECPNKILPFGEIHPGFSADGAVHLRDQSRGNVNQGHATQIRSCCKSGHVANDSAADRDDQRLAIRSRLAKGARNVLDCAKMLCGLRVIEKMQSFSMREPQAALNRLPGSAPDFGRGNDVQAGKMPEVRNFASRMADYTHSGKCLRAVSGFEGSRRAGEADTVSRLRTSDQQA